MIIPVYSTKKSGGSKFGVWGCTVGLLIGMWLGLEGIILGPFIGAFLGELINNTDFNQAMKAAVGSFIGFWAYTVIKKLAYLSI